MHEISVKMLRDFWLRHEDARVALTVWYKEAEAASSGSFNDIKARHQSADVLAGNRVVFNIQGNAYRLIVAIHYNTGRYSSALSERTRNTTGSMRGRSDGSWTHQNRKRLSGLAGSVGGNFFLQSQALLMAMKQNC